MEVVHRGIEYSELQWYPAKKVICRCCLSRYAGHCPLCESLKFKDTMNIGIIGAGHIGSALATRLVSLGHSVYITNSRGPETLKEVAKKPVPRQ